MTNTKGSGYKAKKSLKKHWKALFDWMPKFPCIFWYNCFERDDLESYKNEEEFRKWAKIFLERQVTLLPDLVKEYRKWQKEMKK